jgi:endoglucanase
MKRFYTTTFILVIFCLSGCKSDAQIDKRGKIPIDPKRWYQLNNVGIKVEDLFNGVAKDHLNGPWGALLSNYDVYYPLLDGEQMTIDSIKFYDFEGSNVSRPMTIYAILNDWTKIPIAEFTGEEYNEWVGPDPKHPNAYALKKPVSNVKYLVINSWDNLPGEIEFYGPYKAPKPPAATAVKAASLRNFFGVNMFEWDFEDPGIPMRLDPNRLSAVGNFTGFRHYMDWEKLEGREHEYAFAPTHNGGWNYDVIYEWCKAQNIDVLACLKTIPQWMQATYPADERDNENIPIRYGKDPADPASYLEQAKVAFQYAARYGNNKNVNVSLLQLQRGNDLRTGLGLVKYIECDNERDKWWKGRKAYQTGREYAANLSAFYDGNKNTMGAGVGVKNADPTMKVVMGGLALPSTDYLRGMIDWSKEHRGYRPDGSPDLPWDVINYHFYSNDAALDPKAKQTTGVAPELAKADSFAEEFIRVSQMYTGNMPVWVTEAGYDLHPESPQKAPALKGRDAMEIQAEWTLRTSLLYSRCGVQKLFFYQLYDDNPGNSTRYATCGLVNKERTNRIAADYMNQTNRLFGNYTYKETLNKTPIVDKYTFDDNEMYMLVMPTQANKTSTFKLDVGSADSVFVYKPKAGSGNMDMAGKKPNGGKIDIAVSETPVFVTVKKGRKA